MKREWYSCIALALALAVAGCFGSGSLEDLRAKGQEALERREYAEARGFFIRALEVDTRDKASLVGLAQAYRQDSRYDSAIYYLKRADIMHPKDRDILNQIIEVAVALGDWQNAIDAIESMIRMGDPREPWHEKLADLWLKNGEQGRAFYHARRAIAYGTENPMIYLQAANWAAQYDSMNVAFEVLDSAISKFGPLDQFLVNKALLLAFVGQLRQGEALMREVVAREDPPIPNIQLDLANILAAQPERAKKQEALTIYREIRDLLAMQYPIDSLIEAVSAELK